MAKQRSVSVSRQIAAPAGVIFDILADPSRHAEIDGSGTVRGAKLDDPERLKMGTKFGMKMKIIVPYDMLSLIHI